MSLTAAPNSSASQSDRCQMITGIPARSAIEISSVYVAPVGGALRINDTTPGARSKYETSSRNAWFAFEGFWSPPPDATLLFAPTWVFSSFHRMYHARCHFRAFIRSSDRTETG